MATKIITAALALVMGFTFSAFAGDNKTNKEVKATTEVTISNESNGKTHGTAWFPIGPNNEVPTSLTPILDPDNYCTPGNNQNCSAEFTLDEYGEPVERTTTPIKRKM